MISQHSRELISARKTSQKHSNTDLEEKKKATYFRCFMMMTSVELKLLLYQCWGSWRVLKVTGWYGVETKKLHHVLNTSLFSALLFTKTWRFLKWWTDADYTKHIYLSSCRFINFSLDDSWQANLFSTLFRYHYNTQLRSTPTPTTPPRRLIFIYF